MRCGSLAGASRGANFYAQHFCAALSALSNEPAGKPTEVQIAAVKRFLSRGWARSDRDRLFELIEFQIPRELTDELKPSRVKAEVIATLFHSFANEIEGYEECSNDNDRLVMAREFLEARNGEDWGE